MKIKLKIQQKIQIFIISSALVIYLFSIGYISIKAKQKALKDAIATADLYTKEAANKVKAQMDADMQVVRTLAQAFHTYDGLTNEEWKDLFKKMYYEVFKENEHIYSIWDSWELSVIDSAWNKPYGRYVITYWREKGNIEYRTEFRSMEGDPEMYAKIKRLTNESAWEPYFDVFTEGKSEKNLMTSMSSPIIKNGRYVGIVAIDITLKRFQEIVKSIQPFEGSYAFLVSNGGKIAGHPDVNKFNKTIEELFPEDNRKHRLDTKIRNGKAISYTTEDENGIQTYYTFEPIEILGTTTPWTIGMSVPVSNIMEEANTNFRFSLLIGIVGIILMGVIISLISHSITNPITKITNLLNQLAKGKLDQSMLIDVETGDEIADMAEALNVSVNGLISKKEFAQQIGKGNLDAKIDLLGADDSLGQSLVDMRDSLIDAKKEEVVRQKEDERRRWANEGVASFGEILRQNNDNINKLSNEIVKHLVNYLDANQGGLFIYNDEEDGGVFFELIAAFAYNRKKYIEKKIVPGEGLIGTCALEKETIYMTQIPEEYIEITSGLGGANPTSLLIVPLKLEEEVLGVLEIASFNRMEKHEVEFVERVAESIASTLRSVKINERTTQLLEQSQQQAEEMAAQEEEMRQNMEELQATQEEAARKTTEMEGFMNALNSSSYVIQYDTEGRIIEINDAYLTLLGMRREELIGTHHSDKLEFDDQNKDAYNDFWADLRAGKSRRERTKVRLKDRDFVFIETYTPILDEHGEVYKVLKIAQNITEYVSK